MRRVSVVDCTVRVCVDDFVEEAVNTLVAVYLSSLFTKMVETHKKIEKIQ